MQVEYEALVKIEDNVNPLVPQGELWKAGDIVDIHPKGWVWGRMEVKHFLIANLGFLEETEVEKLTEEITVDYKKTDEDGNVVEQKELVARRRHRVDVVALLDKLLGAIRNDVFDRDKETQPLRQSVIKSSDIEDLILHPEIQREITKRKRKALKASRKEDK